VRSGGCRLHVAGWSPATGHPMPTAAHLAPFLGGCRFGAPAASTSFCAAACFRARFLGGRGGGDVTKSGSTRRGLGRFLSSIISASSSRAGCGGRSREMALPMQRWEGEGQSPACWRGLRAYISAGERQGFQILKWLPLEALRQGKGRVS